MLTQTHTLKVDGCDRAFVIDEPEFGFRLSAAYRMTSSGAPLAILDVLDEESDEALVARLEHRSRALHRCAALANCRLSGGAAILTSVDGPTAIGPHVFERVGALCAEAGTELRLAPGRGVSPRDLSAIVTGGGTVLGTGAAAGGGDLSPYVAFGILSSMEAVATHVLGQEDLTGTRVGICGLSRTGRLLAQRLSEAGCRLYIADSDQAAVRDVCSRLGGIAGTPEDVLESPSDCLVLADPALVLTEPLVDSIRSPLVVAHRPETLDRAAEALHRRGILAVPGLVSGAGAMIACDEDLLERSDDFGTIDRIRSFRSVFEDLIAEANATDHSLYRLTMARADSCAS